jgi:hypothetical protein
MSKDDHDALMLMLRRAGRAPERNLAAARLWATAVLRRHGIKFHRAERNPSVRETLAWYAWEVRQRIYWTRRYITDGDARMAASEAFLVGQGLALGEFKEKMERHAQRGIKVRDGGIDGQKRRGHSRSATAQELVDEFNRQKAHVGKVVRAMDEAAKRFKTSRRSVQRAREKIEAIR